MGPRDGFQSLPSVVPLQHKIAFIRGVGRSGIDRIEAGAFVSTRAVPQMADTRSVLKGAVDVRQLEVLVVNREGARLAADSETDVVVALLTVSETFAAKNTRMSVEDGIAQLADIAVMARDAGKSCVATVSTAFGCGFEGAVSVDAVMRVVEGAARAGVIEVTLCDTVGMASPAQVHNLASLARSSFGDQCSFGLHLHDTRGMGLANVIAGLDAGIRLFDSSVGGLGGCPFSPGATGNIPTEDLVHLLELEGFTTNVDLDAIISVGHELQREISVELRSCVARAGPSWRLGPAMIES